MTSKAMWEVDPETRSKLLAIQKTNNNGVCCDCNAPNPQWASPKFGVFICLSCAGIHRGLGVHISFVRSVTMDAFKNAEIERMRLGGNQGWRTFFEEHEDTQMRGLTWDDATIAERYGGEVGEEWKERLSAKVEGTEYTPSEKPAATLAKQKSPAGSAPTSSTKDASRTGTPLEGSRTVSPNASASGTKAKVDDKYFARLGEENASRSADLPPSQGGKYAGFGNTPGPSQPENDQMPDFAELQKDAVASITKGFGWFTSTVSKTAQNVNSDFLQPGFKQWSESDFAAQAKSAAGNLGRTAQAGAKGAQESFSRFVEGPEGRRSTQSPVDENRRSFWDDFSSLADQRHGTGGSHNAIGTSAMGKGSGAGRNAPPAKKDDEWDDW